MKQGLMYTLLFLLILLCVLALLRHWPDRVRMPLWAGTLACAVLAFLPHVVGRAFHIAL
ncbi:hypothetical protein ACIQUQ_03595 [Streptomyces sp. NPDC101118]|uniref:hypothetical protein n=1 Tax=Streptomyces sp. NPDC101118 TaxID=3366109 RepID=UPI003820ABFC